MIRILLLIVLSVAANPALSAESKGAVMVTEKATFAGGCFWCMTPPFQKIDGVLSAVAGYSGGHVDNPTYKQVTAGNTGHYEAVQITYDPKKVSYEKLLDVLWRNIDPTDDGGQFVDRGPQYRTAIFYHTPEQKKAAEKSKRDLEAAKKYKKPVVTAIVAFKNFFPAEDYHQDYDKKSPVRYKIYRSGSGRDQFLEKHW